MALTPGSRIGVYEIVDLIGSGGMGQVYKARDTKLNRDVALKVLPESLAGDPDRLARFHREAQVLASLNHPNIAQIHGFEDSGSTHALVMELVEGPTLQEIIYGDPGREDGGPGLHSGVPLPEALAIARQIADALAAAHERGIIHRDLKPANVKVREDGTVKVLDFGLAKAVAGDSATASADAMNSPTLTARATQLGMILGTAAYMAPEQAKGRALDRRADIWAFGVVLFEMLAGQRAFKGDDVSDVLAAVLRQEIDWSALPAGTPVGVRRLLERCLERDPNRRLHDIGDAWILMDTATASAESAASSAAAVAAAPAPAAATPARTSAARWLPWAAALVIAGGAVAWVMLHHPPAETGGVTRSAQNLPFSVLINASRDGTSVAYDQIDDSGGASIVLRMLDQFDGRVVPGTEAGAFPLLSPDGQWIAYTQGPDIRKIPVTGGTSIRLCSGSLQNGADWGDDNTIIFAGPKGLMRVSADAGTPETLTTIDGGKGETAHTRPQFLPGGRQVLFTVASREGSQFAVLDLDASKYRTVAKGGDNGRYVASGHLAYLRGSTIFAVPFDLDRLEATGGEVPVVENVSTFGPVGTADYAVSRDGLLAYFIDKQGQGTTLAWADRKGTTTVLPGQSRQQWGTGRLSPDGTRVANGIQNDKGDYDIWTFDTERGTLTRLTFGGTNDLPVWTPDGRQVFYSGTVDGKSGIYSVPSDASAQPALVLSTDSPATPNAFTPDGKTLLYTQVGKDGRSRILVLALSSDAKAGEPHPLHDAAGNEADADVSPDGHWVAYTSSESGSGEVYVQAFPGPGGKHRISLAGGMRARWSKNGRELLYWASVPTSRLMTVDITTSPEFRAGEPHQLFAQLSTTTWGVTPSPDKFLVEISGRQAGSTLAIVTNWFEELKRRAPAKK